MFCPSCGTRNPDGVRFCRACGTNLSGRRAGTTQRPVPAASATPTPAAQAPTPAVPTDRVIGQGGRRSNPFATVAAMVVVGIFVLAVGLQVGSSTSWFGLAKPHLTPGTYTFGKPSSSPLSPSPRAIASPLRSGGRAPGETHRSVGRGRTTFTRWYRFQLHRWGLGRTSITNLAPSPYLID